ncbi:MAG: T9SS type A sorting domain-containing protein [bacterium]
MLNKSIRSFSLIITASILICMLVFNASVLSGEFPTQLKVSQYHSNFFISWLNDHGNNAFVSPFDTSSSFQVRYRVLGTSRWSTLLTTNNTWAKMTLPKKDNTYEFLVRELDPSGSIISLSDITQFTVNTDKSTSGINLGLDITSLTADEFPFIYLTALVDSAGKGLFDLDENNFTVYENGILQDSLFEVFPPAGTNLVATDIVFVFDITGSMGEEITALQTNIQLFADSLVSVGTDFRIGLVTFDDNVYMYNSGNLLPAESLYVFRNWVNSLNAFGGDDGPENAFGALEAATTMNFRPGAQKVFILITDAPAHYFDDSLCSECSYSGQFTSHTQQTIVDLLNANGVTCYTVGPDLGTDHIYEPFCYMGTCYDYQYYGAQNSLTEATGGEWYWILEDFRGIIDNLVGSLASQYVVRYHTKNSECDGVERDVILIADDFGETAQDSASYMPCSTPRVMVTDYTRALENSPQPPGVELTIDVYITDDIIPFPVSATLNFRITDNPVYNSVPMINVSDSLWRGIISSGFVSWPGVDYYVTATDGITTGSAPSADPSLLPYQIAVSPNEAPVITHDPIPTPHPINVSTFVVVDVFDTTINVDFVELYYRRFGDLIYTKAIMEESTLTTYYQIIPAFYSYEFGFEYFIRAVDNYGVASYDGDADFPHQVNVGSGGNISPILTLPESPIYACVSNTITFDVYGTDPDGNDSLVTLSVLPGDLPSGATFTDNMNGSGKFIWTNAGPAGSYPLHFSACDSDTCDSNSIWLVVSDCEGDTVKPTYEWINVYCYNPTLNNEPLVPGDNIKAYDPDGVLCGMYTITDTAFGFMPIYRDDEFSSDIDEGAEPGNLISFTINDEEVFTDPDIFWTANGASFELCNFYSCQKLNLQQGWNLISWNFKYASDMESFLMLQDSTGTALGDCVGLILGFDRGALTYDPSLPQYSTLKDVDYYHGYWFWMECPFELEICGEKIELNDYISINKGWNLISYWPNEYLPVEDALSSIYSMTDVVLGWNNNYQIHIPYDISNTLIEMGPGLGYWVKSTTDSPMSYPGWNYPVLAGKGEQNEVFADIKITPTNKWISIYGSDIRIDGQTISDNSIIKTYGSDGTLCGEGIYTDGILKFTPVYGYAQDNQITANYPKTGDKVEIQINSERVYPDITWSENSDLVQLARLYSEAELVPDKFNLSQNYPNPFNPSTVISFTIPRTSYVELAVYNIIGQKVITLVSDRLNEGFYNVSWDGTNNDGNIVSSGLYLYRLTAGRETLSKKMIFTK